MNAESAEPSHAIHTRCHILVCTQLAGRDSASIIYTFSLIPDPRSSQAQTSIVWERCNVSCPLLLGTCMQKYKSSGKQSALQASNAQWASTSAKHIVLQRSLGEPSIV